MFSFSRAREGKNCEIQKKVIKKGYIFRFVSFDIMTCRFTLYSYFQDLCINKEDGCRR